ncbi:G-protein alpha subunit [Ceratobasidium sp. AG-Ba]|nr:G-protein alpha subunit [Ceratobasidium sp. AG-Ba]QRW15201.1 G-protein alpha subunit [Ceratobasidium sp. AG-Ba]
MIGTRTTPSPTPSRGLTIPMPIFWSSQPSPSDDDPEKKEAQRRSELIDQALKNERIIKAAARKKQRKVLFLGRSTVRSVFVVVIDKYICIKAKGKRFNGTSLVALTDLASTCSESGKSTLVKQFRLMQSPEAFAIERESWKRQATRTQKIDSL